MGAEYFEDTQATPRNDDHLRRHLLSTRQQATRQSGSRSSHVAVRLSRERHKCEKKSLGSVARSSLSDFSPLVCLRPTVVIARPASAQNPAGRDRSLRCVLPSGSHTTRWLVRWLAGWLEAEATPLPAPQEPYNMPCGCRYQTTPRAFLSSACRRAQFTVCRSKPGA